MTLFYHDGDVTLNPSRNKGIAVVWNGSRGRAQAQNMRDSDLDVVIGVSARCFTGENWREYV